MAWGAPPSFTVGEIPTKAKLQTISDDLTYLHDSIPAVSVRRSSNQSITNATWTAVSFDVEDHDTDTMHAGGNPTRITFTTAGNYLLSAHVPFASASNAVGLGARIFYNGASALATILVPGCSQNYNGPTLVSQYAFVAAAYVELQVWQNSGGSLDLLSLGEGVTFSATRL